MWKMPESTRIGESECYFAANQPMRYGIQIVYSLEVEHCNWKQCHWRSDTVAEKIGLVFQSWAVLVTSERDSVLVTQEWSFAPVAQKQLSVQSVGKGQVQDCIISWLLPYFFCTLSSRSCSACTDSISLLPLHSWNLLGPWSFCIHGLLQNCSILWVDFVAAPRSVSIGYSFSVMVLLSPGESNPLLPVMITALYVFLNFPRF